MNIKDINELNTMGKFDVIVGNPPYNSPDTTIGKRKGTGTRLWPQFVDISFNCLNENGIIAYITPADWRLGDFTTFAGLREVRNLMWKYTIVDFEKVNEHFDVAGHIPIDYWIIKKELNKTPISKLKFLSKNKNIIKYLEDAFLNKGDKFILNIKDNRTYSFDSILQSKKGDSQHPYKHLNTISQYRAGLFDWYNKKTFGYNDKKVLITKSVNINAPGNFISLYDNGKMGAGHNCLGYTVKSEKDGKELENFLNNSKIIKDIIKEYNGPAGYKIPVRTFSNIPRSWVERFNTGEDL